MTGPIEKTPGPTASSGVVFRTGTPADTEQCLALWIDACAVRDGVAIAGVSERARPKFDHAERWIVAEGPHAGILGFVLATTPGSGLPGDPPDAPVVGLIAVAPAAQGHRLGGALMSAVADELAGAGHQRAVLHVLMDNHPAVRLYAGNGWRPLGEPYQHSLLNRPTQAYVLDLQGDGTVRC
jgi:ribosomal protein S18 acetylase RimI-like enzyme